MQARARYLGYAIVVTTLGTLAACFSAEPPDGAIACGPVERPCPSGYACAADHTCRRAERPDEGVAADLGPPGPNVRPLEITVPVGRNHFFVADEAVTWSVGEPTGGSISNDGQYLAPRTPGDYTVVATRASDPSTRTIAKVHVHDFTLEVVAGQPGGPGASDGVGGDARFLGPACMSYDGASFVYVCDAARIRRLDVMTQEVVTVAGTRTPGYADAPRGSDARFAAPSSIALYNGALYVAEADNHTIRKIALTPPYPVTTFVGASGQAGYVNGPGATARLSNPHDLLVVGTTMYLADTGNQVIRTISLSDGTVGLFSGTPGVQGGQNGSPSSTTFSDPVGLGVMGGNYLYVTERAGHDVRQVYVTNGYSSLFAGAYGAPGSTGGALTTARFNTPTWVASDGTSVMYVVDAAGLDSFTGSSGNFNAVNLLARGATGPMAVLGTQALLLAYDDAVQAFQPPSASSPTLFAGRGPAAGHTNGFGSEARFDGPRGIAIDGDTAYVADFSNQIIRRVYLSSGKVDDYAGSGTQGSTDGDLLSARFDEPRAVRLVGKILYVADSNVIRKIDTAAINPRVDTLGSLGSLAGSPRVTRHLTDDGAGMLYVSAGAEVLRLSTMGGAPEVVLAGDRGLSGAAGLVFHAGKLYGADQARHTIFVFDPSSGALSRLAGQDGVAGYADGIGDAAMLDGPTAIDVGPDGLLYVSDQDNGLIRRVDPQTGAVTTFAGIPGQLAVIPGVNAKLQLNDVNRLSVQSDGSLVMTSRDENCLLTLK